MNPRVAASRTHPLHFSWRDFCQISRAADRYFVSPLAVPDSPGTPSADATTATTGSARNDATGNCAGFSRLIPPVRSAASRGRHPHHRCRVLGLWNLRPHPRSQVRPRQGVLQPPVSQIRRR